MPIHASLLFDVLTVATCVLILWVPGGLAAGALGVRGWQLAASAPLVTYFTAGMAGILLSALGVRYDVLSFVVCAVVLIVVCAAARWLTVLLRRRRGGDDGADGVAAVRAPGADWLRSSHLVVIAMVLLAAAVGCFVVVRGMGWLDSIPQDWDAAFHANGVRYIADTGDGGLFGMGNINWYEPPGQVFYPNAYHLVAALVYLSSHASIAAVLNSNTVLLPGLLALGLVALVRAFRGRVTTACYTALVAVAGVTGVYENMFRGPLLPYQLGVVLIPVALIALHRYLERPGLDTGLMFVMAAVGLLLVHSSTLFGGTMLALPLLVQRWWGHGRRAVRDVLWLVVAAVVCAVVSAPALLGAMHSASSFASVVWPVNMNVAQAVGSLLLFQHFEPYPQYVLALALVLGLASLRRLGALRWVLGSAVLAGAMFVMVSAYGTQFVINISRPWWDDQYRLIALAFLPIVVLTANGMAFLQDWLGRQGSRLPHATAAGSRLTPRVLTATAAVVLLAVFLVLSNGLYHRTNESIVQRGYGTGPGVNPHKEQVSPDEVRAMQQLPALVEPGDRVMNDRYDGSVWMYAIAGVHPVAAHYDDTNEAPDIDMLATSFNRYDFDPAVRAAVAKLHITYVMIDSGFVRSYTKREIGLTGLNKVDFLQEVYSNRDATIYRLVPPGTGQTG